MARTPSMSSLSVERQAADSLRRLAFALSARTGRRVTMSAALAAAARVASADIDATTAALTGKDTTR